MKLENKCKVIILGSLLSCAPGAFAAPACSLEVPGSSFIADYTSGIDRQKYLNLVESAHFTSSVRNLTRGKSGTHVGPDLSYTIDHFPNHHLALDSLSRYTIRQKTPKPLGVRCSIEGFFERAIEFKPKDGMVRMLYGLHFSRLNQNDKAIKQFEEAEKLDPTNTNLLYNLGLMYFDLKQYDKAMVYADKAYRDDFPLDGLKKKLMKVGKWVEPKKNVQPEAAQPTIPSQSADETSKTSTEPVPSSTPSEEKPKPVEVPKPE